MQKNALQIMLALALVLVAGYYWLPGGNPQLDEDVAEKRRSLPKNYARNARSWEYNEDGSLKEILEAEQVEYFAGRKMSELTQPRFYSHDGNDRTWSVTAERGKFQHRSETLQLLRNVVMHNDKTGGTLKSMAMTIEMKQRTAIARVPVTITEGDYLIRADGMTADLTTERVILAPNVETTYVLPPN